MLWATFTFCLETTQIRIQNQSERPYCEFQWCSGISQYEHSSFVHLSKSGLGQVPPCSGGAKLLRLPEQVRLRAGALDQKIHEFKMKWNCLTG